MKDYVIGTCRFRQRSTGSYCNALRQVFKEESLTIAAGAWIWESRLCGLLLVQSLLRFALLEYCDSVLTMIESIIALTPQNILN
jgi:hypothetical protein